MIDHALDGNRVETMLDLAAEARISQTRRRVVVHLSPDDKNSDPDVTLEAKVNERRIAERADRG